MKAAVKFIGASGQISLGKEFAGRQVLVEEPEPGVWLVRTASVIPDNERWLHTPEAKQALTEGLAWIAKNPARATDLSVLKKSLDDGAAKPERSKSAGRTRSKHTLVSTKLVRA